MSIETEITRLTTIKTDLKSAIANKGVAVPDAAAITDYAGYVEQIQAGTKTAKGTFSCGADTKSVTLEIGFVPNFLFIWCENVKISTLYTIVLVGKTADIGQLSGISWLVNTSKIGQFPSAQTSDVTITSTGTTTTITANYTFSDTESYAWFACL